MIKKHDHLNNKLLIFTAFLAVLFACAFQVKAHAEVSFSTDGTEGRRYVSVAGNPDCYPFEYYDAETETYKGIIPNYLELLSEQSDVDLVYVQPGKKDSRLYLAKIGEADLISAWVFDEEKEAAWNLQNTVALYTFENDGKEVTIGVAFGPYADEHQMELLTDAAEKISQQDLASLAAGYAAVSANAGSKDSVRISLLPVLILSAVVLLLAVTVLYMLFFRKKGEKKDKKEDKQEKLDALTGLPYRETFEQNFQRLVANPLKAYYAIACIGFDADKAADYEDTNAEDQLKFAGTVLQGAVDCGDQACRINLSAFCVLHACGTREEAIAWCEGLLSSLNADRTAQKGSVIVPFRAGIVHVLEGQKLDFVYRKAHSAYAEAVKQEVSVFMPAPENELDAKMDQKLLLDLPGALSGNQFVSYVQPMVETATGQIAGGESLIRWEHPEYGTLRPGRFIPLVLESGRIADLDYVAFENACRCLQQWDQEGKTYFLSTNFTRVSLISEDFSDRVQKILSKYMFKREHLTIEITEVALAKNEKLAMENIRLCKNLGFRIALDDLGSGYTMFSDLTNYPLDVIKIDKDFFYGYEDPKTEKILRGIIRICKDLNLLIVCEGVETRLQYDVALKYGCDFIQGYYFYQPLPPSCYKMFM